MGTKSAAGLLTSVDSMAQLPNVKLQIHPSMFDLMMAVLERNAASEDVPTRSNARDLMEKRMRFTRLYFTEKRG